MVRLDDDPYTVQEVHRVNIWTRLINCVRIHNVPAINYGIICILGLFLLRLTTKYNELYMKNSLVTIIVTNLVLYGISETLAQSLLSYDRNTPRISVRIHDADRSVSFNSNDISLDTAPHEEYSEEENMQSTSLEGLDDVNEESVNRFLDYLRTSDSDSISEAGDYAAESTESGNLQPDQVPAQLTYFQFGRLAGFMCWGFILAFAQCWWYLFLRIYLKHPQFIEVLRKVMLDQFCYSPISLACFFIYGTMVLENGTWDDTTSKLRRVYLKTLMINYSVWFPVQFVNFLMVPRNFQVPFSLSVLVLWNCFLSMRNSTS